MAAHILYLDDESAIVFLMTRMLEHLGFEAHGFTHADEALQAFAAAPDRFNLVVTDLSMPGPGGLGFAREVLKVNPNAHVVIATSSINPRDADAALAVGVREVIEKPSSFEQMAELMKRLLPGTFDAPR